MGKSLFLLPKMQKKGNHQLTKNGDPMQVKLLFTCKLLFHYGFENFEESIEHVTVIIFFLAYTLLRFRNNHQN